MIARMFRFRAGSQAIHPPGHTHTYIETQPRHNCTTAHNPPPELLAQPNTPSGTQRTATERWYGHGSTVRERVKCCESETLHTTDPDRGSDHYDVVAREAVFQSELPAYADVAVDDHHARHRRRRRRRRC